MSQNFPPFDPSHAVQAANVLYVAPSAKPNGDGTWARPFQTYAAAAAAIEAALDAAIDNQYLVLILEPLLQEMVLIRSPFTHVVFATRRAGVITVPTGPAVFMTDATSASITNFLGAGGGIVGGADALYPLLANDPALVWPNGVVGPIGSSVYNAVLRRDVSDPTAFNFMQITTVSGNTSGEELTLTNVDVQTAGYFRNMTFATVRQCEFGRDLIVRQTRLFEAYNNKLYSADIGFNTTDPRSGAPFDTVGVGNSANNEYGASGNNVIVRGEAICFEHNAQGNGHVQILDEGNLTLEGGVAEDLLVEDEATVECNGSTFRDECDISAVTNLSVVLNGCYVGNGITIGAGGVKAVTMNGGGYLGALTDPDGAFVRNAAS